jgi:hypothetical protein
VAYMINFIKQNLSPKDQIMGFLHSNDRQSFSL